MWFDYLQYNQLEIVKKQTKEVNIVYGKME
jgi:hypothetical protein